MNITNKTVTVITLEEEEAREVLNELHKTRGAGFLDKEEPHLSAIMNRLEELSDNKPPLGQLTR